MSHETLCLIWFVILGVLLTGYAILDGFDLGVGILHPFASRNDHERRVLMNSIGPLWDGNEVWLVTFGGAMFAMFPEAYATIFSGFYTAFMTLLFALIFRAVSLEFRSKMHSSFWRGAWDFGFFLGSTLAALLFGVAVGNLLLGMPLDAQHEYTGSLLEQLNPYALLTGAMTVAVLAMHGSIFLYLKTEGELQERIHRNIWRTFGLFLVMFLITTGATLVYVPGAVRNFKALPILWIVPVLSVLAIANIPRAIYLGRPGYAFASSSCTIAALAFLLLAGIFPDLVPASNDPAHSLDIYKAASSAKTLTLGLVIVALGMPCVLTYTAIIYWTFRGKVELGEHSY